MLARDEHIVERRELGGSEVDDGSMSAVVELKLGILRF